MVVFDEDQIANVDVKLNWEGSFYDLNADTMTSKLMLYTSQQNTCSVSIKDPYFTSIAWPALLDVAGQTISSAAYSPGVTTILRECGKGEDPKKDGCYRYEDFNYNTYFASGVDGADPNSLFTSEDDYQYRYVPAMLLISFWYDTPSGYTFGTDYVYMVTNASVTHGKNYPTVDFSGSGNYGIVFQNGLLNMSISDKNNIELSITEIVKKLGYEPTFCKANYDEPRKLDRKVAFRNVTASQGIDKLVKEYLGGDTLSLPTKDFFRKLHICTRSDGALGRRVFYLGKPLYESYNITAKYDQSFIGRNLATFGSGSLVPGQQGGVLANAPNSSSVSTYKLEDLSSADKSVTILKHTPKNPLAKQTFSGDKYTLGSKSKIAGVWKDFKSDRNLYLTTANSKQFFLEAPKPTDVVIKTYTKLNSWYAGNWGVDNVVSPVRGEVISNEKGSAVIKADVNLFLRGNTTNEVSKFPVYVEIQNIEKHEQKSKVEQGDTIGYKGTKDLLMRFYILNASAKVFVDIPTIIEFAIEDGATLPGAPTPTTPTIQKTTPVLTPSSNSIPIEKLKSLKELIISGESPRSRAEAANNKGSLGTISKYVGAPGSSLTISQLMKFQEQGKIRAIGWLQVIPDTLKKVVAAGGIDPSLKFTEQTQDQIFLWLIKNKRPQVYAYLTGANDDLIEAAQDIAREWASIGISKPEAPEAELRASGVTIKPKHKIVQSVGRSLYSEENSNKASISPQAIQNTLKKIKESLPKIQQTPILTQEAESGSTQEEALPVGYVWPSSGIITSGYGWRGSRVHKGIDIAKNGIVDVVASASGEVIDVYNKCPGNGCTTPPPYGGYGNVVLLKHSNGQTTLYAHLKQNILVKPGDIVSQRQKIGEMGNTGSSTGQHLHFEIRSSSGVAQDFSTQRVKTQVTEGEPIPLKIDASGVINYTGSSPASSGEARKAVPAYGTSNAGFTIQTEFKGVPRALRIVPKFTTISLVSNYQQWLRDNFSTEVDPGVWVADEYFRNWIVKSVQYLWSQGDLRVVIEGSSPIGVATQNIVPRWEQFQEMLRAGGYKDSYVDYIRAFGDLCWEDGTGYNSCEDMTTAEEVFTAMQTNQNGAQPTNPALISTSSADGLCNTDPQAIGISPQEYKDLINMIASEASNQKTNEAGVKAYIPLAMVSRAILNRWIVNREIKGPNQYGANSSDKTLKGVLFARRSPKKGDAEFSPIDDGNFAKPKTKAQLDDATTAFRLSLNTELLLSLGVPKEGLQATNFRNPGTAASATDVNWKGGTYRPGGKEHVFSGDGVSRKLNLIQLWDKYYGKCTPITKPASQDSSQTIQSGYKPIKANTGTWVANVNKPVETIFVIGAGHQADPECGAAGSQKSLKVYKGGWPGVPSTIESAMTRRALDIFIKVAKSKGIQTKKFVAQRWSKRGCGKNETNPSRSAEWDRLIAQSEALGQQYYALELHFDAYDPANNYPGYSGILAPSDASKISKIDDALGKVFGKFSQRVGLNNRGGTLFEIGPADPYITDAFLRGETQGDFSLFDKEITIIAERFWSIVQSVK
jgi:murein DD-endopeptidase MepM/ murein hydrolase activator NlpD